MSRVTEKEKAEIVSIIHKYLNPEVKQSDQFEILKNINFPHVQYKLVLKQK